eukprot:CAMPEP_0198290404 /NCGR_PEP_ID=MMETSP1449-20131203/8292_1 /TAXON_ID=420275 /ORGANISM="Attheya septentrionalis, Strain CCMP2084" /LENGTH=592 /DNA_ID=CAMNT_0043988909 /DNA_START=29 /DNA_END=1807 /DNA_ORIENTATION=-
MDAMMEKEDKKRPLVSFQATSTGPKCPFGNEVVEFELYEGGCVCLSGNSGFGKTTLATYLAGLSTERDLQKLDIRPSIQWDPSISAPGERCGVLFQQTTLIDSLTVAANVCVALEACQHKSPGISSKRERDHKIQKLLETVGLDYARDGPKRPTQLSGGMARRASLALQLAQRKRVIVLDEPFAGLDRTSAASVASELVHLRLTHGTSLLLISHEPDLAALVMDKKCTQNNATVTLLPPPHRQSSNIANGSGNKNDDNMAAPNLFGINAWHRFAEQLADYVMWSIPLIGLTFIACGLAISMLSADILQRIDVTEPVIEIVDKEVKPLLKLITGQESNAMTMMMVKMKVRSMLNTVLPDAKANLFAIGMAKLFVLEIGPLLTALLLCGRIGGSYAGKVATMQATSQNKLLQTLGINPQLWTFMPSLAAALIASPLLTVMGTTIALWLGGIVGPNYGIGSLESYTRYVQTAVFPTLRLRGVETWQQYGDWFFLSLNNTGNVWTNVLDMLDLRCTWSDSYVDALVEVATWPPFFLLLKSTLFIMVILVVAEAAARLRPNLTPRDVPNVITSSVVIASLLVIIADWGFSQLWLLRK